MRRHLKKHDRLTSNAGALVELGGMVADELAHDLGLAHAGRAVEEQAWHAIAWRIVQKVLEAAQRQLGTWIADPAVGPNEADALGGGEFGIGPVRRR